MAEGGVFRRVDAVTVPVPDLEAGLRFYGRALGHRLKWRNDAAGQAGLELPDGDSELVLTTRQTYEPNWLVDSVDDAVELLAAHGADPVAAPFDIPVGRAAVVRDPFGNTLVLVDLSKGTYLGAGKPDLAVGLIRVRDATERPAEQGVGIDPHVVEVTATVVNVGDVLANETSTRFWVEGVDVDRELRVVHTPDLPAGEEIEVTALWDVRERQGTYAITVTADAFSQIDELRTDNNSATVHVAVRGTRVELA